MVKKILNKTLLLAGSCVVLLISTSSSAIPKAIYIPETLRDGKLLDIHRKQVNDRIAWWKKRLIEAISDEEIQRAGQKLLGDYHLYPNPSYQKEFAEETLKQYTDILNGKAFQSQPDNAGFKDDPLALLKRINAALILTKMNQPEMQPALQILVADKNEALRFLGWMGYNAMRKNLLNGLKKDLTPLLETAPKALTDETNPILLSEIFRVMNFGTIEGTVNEKLRLVADAAFLKTLQASWSPRCKQVQETQTTEGNLLPAMRLAVLALRSIGEDFNRAEPKDDKSVTLCRQLIFDMTAAAAQTYDRAWQDRAANTALLNQCTDLLEVCENALNDLVSTKHTFLTDKLNPRNPVPARGAAVVEAAMVHWGKILKDKGLKESDKTKQP